MANPSPRPTCSFCGRDKAEVELLFVSDIGGTKPAICDGCVIRYSEIAALHRRAPHLAAQVITAANAAVAKAKREARS